MTSIILLLTQILMLAYAEVHNVDVGKTGPNFNPSNLLDVAVGDVVNFHFYPTNHSVAESSFNAPCKPKMSTEADGNNEQPIFSGFVPVSSGVASQMWSMTVNTTDPIWLYCSQGEHQHCRNGQSMVINPPSNSDQTLDAYMQAALNANVTSPDEVFGGVLVDDDGGEPDQGMKGLPATTTSISTPNTDSTTTASANNTAETTARLQNGVVPMAIDAIWEMGVWGSVILAFIVTL